MVLGKPYIHFKINNEPVEQEIDYNYTWATTVETDRGPVNQPVLINTASIQIIPTTAIAVRKSLGSEKCTDILIPVWCATMCAALAGIIAVKILIKIKK